jgi:hypothetical protein
MCRLFGMTAGWRPLRATFRLLEAPDSLVEQSRRNPDGYGIATYEADRSPRVNKRPAAAYEDESFAREAKESESPTFRRPRPLRIHRRRDAREHAPLRAGAARIRAQRLHR